MSDPERVCGPVLTCLADVAPQEVSWLWPGKIPLRRITLLVGRPGEGKSFLTCDWAARVSRGWPWPDGSPCPQGSVILITGEDDPGDTVRPRCDAAGADANQIHLLTAIRYLEADGSKRDLMFTLADVAALEVVLQQQSDCKLIVVDPVGSFLGGRVDAHRDNEVRSVLSPIGQLAERYGPAVVVVAHRRKSGGGFADDLALGSRAFTGIARAVWHLSRDPENRGRRLLLPGKNNLGPEGDGYAFTIDGEPPQLLWEPEPLRMNADDALAREQTHEKPGPEPEARNAAADWLRQALTAGPRLAKEIAEEAREEQAISSSTLRRAREDVGVVAFRPVIPGPWWWQLPVTQGAHARCSSPLKEKKPEHLGHLCARGQKEGNNNGLLGPLAKAPRLYVSEHLGPEEAAEDRAQRHRSEWQEHGYPPGVRPA